MRLVLPLALLGGLAAGLLYVRLLNGPISLKFVAEPIARTIAAEMPGLAVNVEDATVALTDAGHIEFRLLNVRFSDAQGEPVAVAPLAAVQLNYNAIWKGQIAPRRVVLIEPRLLLSYSQEQGLALRFSRTPAGPAIEAGGKSSTDGGDHAQAGQAPPAEAGDMSISVFRPINVAQTLVSLAAEGRRGGNAASFLRGVGVRNATVVFEHGGRRTTWRLADAEFGVDHNRRGSIVGGNLTVAAPYGAWRFSFVTENDQQANSMSLKASVHDLVPSAIARQVPELVELAALDLPMDGHAEIELSAVGELLGADFKLDLKRGSILTPWLGRPSLGIDGGSINLRYVRDEQRLEVQPSTVAWGESRITVAGSINPATKHVLGGDSWLVDLRATEGQLAAEEFGVGPVPVSAMRLRGLFIPTRRTLEVTEFALKAGEADIGISGSVAAAGPMPSISLQGRMGPMSIATAKTLWPAPIAPAARSWVGNQVLGGKVVSGTFTLEQGEAGSDRLQRAGTAAARLSVAIETSDINFVPHPGLAAVEAPRALVRLEGNALEVAVPEASVAVGGGKLSIRGGRLLCSEAMAPMAFGELTFRAQGTAGAALAYLDQDALRADRPLGLSSDRVEGKAEAQFKITVPLGDAVSASDARIEGKGRVTEGRARDVLGSYDVHGATIAFEITEQAVDVSGDFLISGVPAKVNWQRIIGARDDQQQPPLRIRATLDANDRSELGINVNDLVQGELPIELTITLRPGGAPPLMQVRGDLTNAELLIESLAWRKPPGRSAFVQFDVVKVSEQRSELQNFKVVGEDIAIDGTLVRDGQGRVREFNFPDFSVNVVSRLVIQGVLRDDNVWDVKVQGTTFDGRDVFQSIYSVGQLRDRPLPDRKDRPGLDVRADIDTVLGFSDLSLKGLHVEMSKRGGKLVSLIARGSVPGGARGAATTLEVGLQQTRTGPRTLVALSDDAGQVFRLFGFYPNMQGGRMRLEVNLDGRGPAEKTGLLQVRQFNLLGDPVVYEVLQGPDGTRGSDTVTRRRRTPTREQIPFESMRAPFSVGHGQLVLEDADLRGPILGAVLKGKADFRAQHIDLGGTYVPLQGLNSAVGYLPGLGQLLAGPRGEGVLGMTFAVQGPMARPQVLVNPLSFALPGILREMMQMTNPTPRVTPRDNQPARPGQAPAVRSSSTSAGSEDRPEGAVEPRVDDDGGWRSETVPSVRRPQPRE